MPVSTTQGISGHGTTVEFQAAATPGVWTVIGEIGDIQLPGLMRNEFDVTSQNRNIDTYALGVLRRDALTFPMFFNKALTSQLLLRTAILANTVDGYRVTTPDSDVWIFSGGVQAMKHTSPVDGVQTADVTIRMTGSVSINGTIQS
ncbi:hypothetical protein UFOVP1196_73 [uncultured Caudovirales phage]|uniref:Phage tail tube protein n=1 Tax=uncultured Caudovirales phage TaxID=2100421 RepID=A0A6J5R156_9CAUD|nr:hypothetical protein UFOVP1196_73 [uncultured Caudovirales phage]